MKNFSKIAVGLALAISAAASPSLAQDFNNRGSGYGSDGTLNVWGANLDPARPQRGPLGAVGNVVGGVTGAVGGVVGGTVGAADDIVTGSIAPRRGGRDARYSDLEQEDEMVNQDQRGRSRGAY
ncbi:hypothetical protein [Methylobacterium brachythecii]|uniref:Glycine zipper domain-containing protein n=1 Tax=Methylobacterium brachythecii TaxID=1176177 RepID=A0A7W6AN08_9HYPH|nr:hypothetical protein [Methylobacterium brachythecii]MBB3905593.1 hypothetical protein [Methylobacterium brachythecii]GLS47014.1 hypothetical protein GCM10007884_50140 [Methylobacterium brachythecii]